MHKTTIKDVNAINRFNKLANKVTINNYISIQSVVANRDGKDVKVEEKSFNCQTLVDSKDTKGTGFVLDYNGMRLYYEQINWQDDLLALLKQLKPFVEQVSTGGDVVQVNTPLPSLAWIKIAAELAPTIDSLIKKMEK